MRTRLIRFSTSVALAVVVLAACGTTSVGDSAASAPRSNSTTSSQSPKVQTDGAPAAGFEVAQLPQLSGTTYESTAVVGMALQPKTVVRIAFDGSGRLSASAGCNNLSAPAVVDAGRLSVGQMSQSLLACDAGRMTQDKWLSGVLTSTPLLTVNGSQLMVASGETVITLERKPPQSG